MGGQSDGETCDSVTVWRPVSVYLLGSWHRATWRWWCWSWCVTVCHCVSLCVSVDMALLLCTADWLCPCVSVRHQAGQASLGLSRPGSDTGQWPGWLRLRQSPASQAVQARGSSARPRQAELGSAPLSTLRTLHTTHYTPPIYTLHSPPVRTAAPVCERDNLWYWGLYTAGYWLAAFSLLQAPSQARQLSLQHRSTTVLLLSGNLLTVAWVLSPCHTAHLCPL